MTLSYVQSKAAERRGQLIITIKNVIFWACLLIPIILFFCWGNRSIMDRLLGSIIILGFLGILRLLIQSILNAWDKEKKQPELKRRNKMN